MRALNLSKLVRRDPDRPTLKQRAAALKATAARVMRRKAVDAVEPFPVDKCPPGFVPYPFDDPQSFTHVPGVLQAEGERLLGIAMQELDRRLDRNDRSVSNEELRSSETLHRRLLRIDALMVLAGQMDPPRGSLPEPGSDAALAAFHAACGETDRRSQQLLDGYPELRRADQPVPTWWSADCLQRAIDSGEVTPAEYARLYPLAKERELRHDAAALSTNLGALYALAYADSYPIAAEDKGDDATVLDTIKAHAAAYAEWDRLDDEESRFLPSDPAGATARAAAAEAERLEETTFDALLHVRPSTVAGLRELLSYLPEAAGNTAPSGAESVQQQTLDAIREAAFVLDDAASSAPRDHDLACGADPALVAIRAALDADAAVDAFSQAVEVDKPDDWFEREDTLVGVQSAAKDRALATVPTTRAGQLALVDYLRRQMRRHGFTNGDPPEPNSPIWRDAYRALSTALASPVDGSMIGADAELLALEARYENARDKHCAASDALDEAGDAYVEPPMPDELRVRDGDWRLAGIPQTGAQPIGGGKFRSRPYGAKEVEHLRANPCMGVYVGGTEGKLQPDGVSRMRPHKRAQARADAIIAAWDEWQAAIAASREAIGLPAAEAAESEARERRYAILPAIRDARALTLAGLAVKARAAAYMALEDDLWAIAKRFDPEQEDGLLFALAANVIDLAGSHSGAPARG